MEPKGLPSYCYWGTPPRDPNACDVCGETDCRMCQWCGDHDVPLELYRGDQVCQRCIDADVADQRDAAAKEFHRDHDDAA